MSDFAIFCLIDWVAALPIAVYVLNLIFLDEIALSIQRFYILEWFICLLKIILPENQGGLT